MEQPLLDIHLLPEGRYRVTQVLGGPRAEMNVDAAGVAKVIAGTADLPLRARIRWWGKEDGRDVPAVAPEDVTAELIKLGIPLTDERRCACGQSGVIPGRPCPNCGRDQK